MRALAAPGPRPLAPVPAASVELLESGRLPLTACAEPFGHWLEAHRGLSAHTVRAYGGVTRSFLEFSGQVGLRYVDEVRPKHVEAYLLWLRRTKRLKSATVNHRRAALVTWWRFLIGQEAATANPAAPVYGVKQPQTRCAG